VQNSARVSRLVRLLLFLGLAAILVGTVAGAQASDQDILDEARALLSSGALEAATQRAHEAVAATPGRGAAHLVLGLALFRTGRYQEALASFAVAKTCAQPASPGPTAFNEGAALFALKRYREAQAAFEQAARIAPDLAFLATVNAAESALAEGDATEARRLASAAEPLAATGERRDVVADLEQRIDRALNDRQQSIQATEREQARAALAGDQPEKAEALYRRLLHEKAEPSLTDADRNLFEHGLGLALLRQNRYAEAAEHFALAAALDPRDGDSLYMQGVADYRAGNLRQARILFRNALDRDMDQETIASTQAFLERLSFGSRRAGEGGSLGIFAGGGYDSNVIQGAPARPETITPDQVGGAGAFFATASANAGYGWLLGRTGFVGADYDVDQLAYPDSDHQDYSLQDHNLRLRAEWSPSSIFRVSMMGGEEMQFSGLSGFRAFQNVLTAEPGLAVDESPTTSTNLRVRVQKKNALDHDYDYYSGSRVDIRVGQRVRIGSVRGELALRHRLERIGTREATLLEVGTSQTFKFRKRKATDPVDEASYVYSAPYGYDSNAVLASFEMGLGRFRVNADASAEILDFRGESQVYFVVPTMNVNRLYQSQHRKDLHLCSSLAVAARLAAHAELALRYDLTDNRSTLILDVDDRNYLKHVVTLTVEADW
jgi:tetratricopeptide (TPR) repeat protein